MFFKFWKAKPKTTAEEKLEQISNILFPPLKSHTDKEGNKFHIDSSADINLDAVLSDLEDGHNDAASRKTIKGVADRIYEIRKIIEAYDKLHHDAKYVIVEDLEDNKNHT